MTQRRDPKYVSSQTLEEVLVLGPRKEPTKEEEAEARGRAILKGAGFRNGRTRADIISLIKKGKEGKI